ncbi:MAG: BMC domain-containing protein [Peptococcaceae bacterium]|jgi:ethanolamine utilization microcompartment shell protein EutS|nr:BMC domain-containing protein [Peptococcaceae bacterium]MEE0206944.1 BMC domain-containing protein [Peptococcaceae bacterium]
MDIRIIKSPSAGTVDILLRRKGSDRNTLPPCTDAIGLVQGKMIDMVVAADIAEKAVGVTVEDIRGSCPQNMILLAIFGDTASVESALAQIRQEVQGGTRYTCLQQN